MSLLILAAAVASTSVAAPTPPSPIVLAQAGAPAAAAPAAPPLGPPRAFQGYTQPDIGASACKVVNSSQTTCQIPGMTAGRYLIEASGTSTALAAGATQKVAIIVGSASCGEATRKPTAQKPWTVGTPKTLKLQCEVEILTDRPLPVIAYYADDKATKAPAGPTLVVKRLPWDGVLSMKPGAPAQD